MSHKYGDSVVFIQKTVDAEGQETVRRLNAIVLGSFTQPQGAEKLGRHKQVLRNHTGKPLPAGEYLDLAYPNPGIVLADGNARTRAPELIFRLAFHQALWTTGAFTGWEPSIKAEDVTGLVEALSQSRGINQALRSEIGRLSAKTQEDAPKLPSAADLDALAAEQAAKDSTASVSTDASDNPTAPSTT
jgi:hypothetical protein